MTAGSDLVAFVDWLDLSDEQSLTVVAHSFGSVVTGTALADYGLRCTDVVVAGSPGMTVDELRQLHVDSAHFFSEKAPGDTVAELGIFGAAPTSSAFGGTRMQTNAPGHEQVLAHSHYFEPGSEALENMVAVVTGRYGDVHRHVWSVPEIAGGLVCWTLRLPDHAGARRGPSLPRARLPGHGQRHARVRPGGGADRQPGPRGTRRGRTGRGLGGAPGRGQLDAVQLARRELTTRVGAPRARPATGCPFPIPRCSGRLRTAGVASAPSGGATVSRSQAYRVGRVHARLLTFTGNDRIDDVLFLWEATVVILRAQEGFRGVAAGIDRKAKTATILSLWASEADLIASDAAMLERREAAMVRSGATMQVEQFEQVSQTIAKAPTPGSALMLTRLHRAPDGRGGLAPLPGAGAPLRTCWPSPVSAPCAPCSTAGRVGA